MGTTHSAGATPADSVGRAVVASAATALCPAVPQGEVRDLAGVLYPHLVGTKYLTMFDNAGITTRRLARPVSWYAEPHSQTERFALAVEVGADRAHHAAASALGAAGVDAADVDAIVVASSTVVRTPGLDVALVGSLGLRSDVRRVTIGSFASLGGAAALALGADLVAAGHRTVLVVACEMNSFMFTPGDDSPGALAPMALFSDGAAAVVLTADGDPNGLRIVGTHAQLVPDSLGVMGFDVNDDGLAWRLAPNVPEVAAAHAGGSVAAALGSVGWETSSVDHLLVHPGGVRVLDAVADAIGVGRDRLAVSLEVLADMGNVSGATVLAVLERHLAAGPPPGRTLLTAMGPGFGFEHVMMVAG